MISPVFGWCSMGTHGISRFAHGIAMLDCSDRRSWTAGVWKKTERRNLNGYPLVMTNIAIENDHRNSRFTHWKWWFSIVMLVYRRVCRLMDGGGLKKNKKSSVLKLTHKGIPVRCRLENTACGWHLKPLTFEVHGQGLKVRCGSWRFSWGREIFVLMKFKGKQPLDCWCLTHVNRIKWVWVLLLPRDQTLDHLGCHFPLNQRITPGNLTIQATNWRLWMPPVSSRQDGGFCFVSCFFSTSVAPFLGTCLAWF